MKPGEAPKLTVRFLSSFTDWNPFPQKPVAALFLASDEARFVTEPKPTTPVGDAPEYMRGRQVAIWDEVKSHCVEGVLTISDRFTLEILVIGLDRARFGTEKDNADGESHTVSCEHITCGRVYKQLGKLGMNPAP